MSYIGTNFVAIAAATVAGLLVGIAYAMLMGARGAGEARGYSAAFIGLAVAAEFWLASILAGALILAPSQAGVWTMALGSAIVIWVGFVLPTLLVTNLFEGRPGHRGVLNCCHWLAVMLVQAAVLQSMGLIRPT